MKTIVSVIWIGLVLFLSSCGGDTSTREATDQSPDSPKLANPTANRTGPLGSGATIRCVEKYSPVAVAKRAFAFEGVVIRSAGSISDRGDEADLALPGVTLRVNQWFGDAHGSTFTVDLQVSESAFDVGSRLLVSGESRWGDRELDDAIAWPCGFTRYYDAKTAQAWQSAH